MSTLSGQKIKDKFGNLLHVEGGVTSTTKNVEDGTGDASALKLSSTKVEINGTLDFTTAPTTSGSEATALLINGSNEVVKRELGTAAFLKEFPRIIARVASDQAVADGTNVNAVYAPVDNSDATASFAQDAASNYSFPTTSRIEVGTAGIYRIDVSLYLTGNTGTPNITIDLNVNGATVASAYRSKTASQPGMASFFFAQKLAEDDYISVNVACTSGDTVVTAASCVEVLQIA